MHSRTITHRIPFVLGATLSIAASVLAVEAGMYAGQHREDVAVATVTSQAAELVALHGCWQDEAPADVSVPGHVVVTVDGVVRYGGARLTGRALEQVFDGADYGLTVHAFCR